MALFLTDHLLETINNLVMTGLVSSQDHLICTVVGADFNRKTCT